MRKNGVNIVGAEVLQKDQWSVRYHEVIGDTPTVGVVNHVVHL